MTNRLYCSDDLDALREHVATESVNHVYFYRPSGSRVQKAAPGKSL